mgnify:FL=1
MSLEEWLGEIKTPANAKTKQCSECRQVLPEQYFHKNRSTKDRLAKSCKTCFKILREGTTNLKILHPMPDCCDICGATDRRMTLDHCHETGEFRGWLCLKCNSAIGWLNEDVDIMIKATNYVKNCKPQKRYENANPN